MNAPLLRTRVLNLARSALRTLRLDERLPPLTNGKRLDSLIARVPPNHYQYPSPTLRTAERDGIRYELDLSDYMEWLVYYGIETEPRRALYDLIEPGAHVLDIGTNIGEVALNAAKIVGAEGVVWAFEPSPQVLRKLQRNMSLNAFGNLRVFPHALGDREEVVPLATPSRGNRGGTRIVPAETARDADQIAVRPLDALVAELAPRRIDVVKIDVEGYETRVLRGGLEALRRFRPTLFVEVDDANLRACGSSARELATVLEQLGYTSYVANDGRPFRSDLPVPAPHFDAIARCSS